MPCESFKLNDGTKVVACTRGPRRREPCTVPGCSSTGGYLCDWPLSGEKFGTTCSRSVCGSHRKAVGKDQDLCPVHGRMFEENGNALPQLCVGCRSAPCACPTVVAERK
jgi:hypothetical protein